MVIMLCVGCGLRVAGCGRVAGCNVAKLRVAWVAGCGTGCVLGQANLPANLFQHIE